MEIKLKGDYIITSDSRQYILSTWKMVKNKNGIEEMKLGTSTFHGTIESTLKAYRERMIRGSDLKTLEAILKLVKEMDEYIHEILKTV